MKRIQQFITGMFLLGGVLIGGMLPVASLGSELTDAEFRRLHAELQPAPDEPWRTIPWKIALLDAQRTAAKEKKPIFIWAMDGHPLGCT